MFFKKLSYIGFEIRRKGDLNPKNRGDCRKAIRVGPTKINQLIMEQNTQNPLAGLHKQKLYVLIAAGVGLIALLLPWRTIGGFKAATGFNGLGLISLLGVVGVIVATFMGDKSKPFAGQTKQIALGSFGAIALGAILVLVTKASFRGYKIPTNPGLGAFIAIAVGVAGLLFLMGIIKVPDNKPKA